MSFRLDLIVFLGLRLLCRLPDSTITPGDLWRIGTRRVALNYPSQAAYPRPLVLRALISNFVRSLETLSELRVREQRCEHYSPPVSARLRPGSLRYRHLFDNS